jgi:hypothetical protein
VRTLQARAGTTAARLFDFDQDAIERGLQSQTQSRRR